MYTGKTVYVGPGGGFDRVSVAKSDALPPKPNEITVRLYANSLNYHDYVVVKGTWGPTETRIPMADGAGEVVAVGEAVEEFKVGDAVVSTFFPTWLDGEPTVYAFSTVPGDGVDGYAREYVTAAATSFTHAPHGWTHIEASTLTTAGLTAWRALMCFEAVKPGDTVLTQGTGGVSIFALQFAKMMGATVIATSSSDAKLERLTAMGADQVINYRKEPEWGAVVRSLTDGRGVDHVIEVGGANTLEQSVNAVKVGGQILLIGILSGLSGELSIINMLAKQVRLQGVLVGSRAQQQAMIRAINANHLKPIVDTCFPVEQIVEAFQYQETNQHFGKICLTI